MMDNLLGKTIVVTGSNGLIGKELVRNLIELNCNIISLDTDFKGEELKKEERIIEFEIDISNENSLSLIINESFKEFGSIDGLVHCAGIDFKANNEENNINMNKFENLEISEFEKNSSIF